MRITKRMPQPVRGSPSKDVRQAAGAWCHVFLKLLNRELEKWVISNPPRGAFLSHHLSEPDSFFAPKKAQTMYGYRDHGSAKIIPSLNHGVQIKPIKNRYLQITLRWHTMC